MIALIVAIARLERIASSFVSLANQHVVDSTTRNSCLPRFTVVGLGSDNGSLWHGNLLKWPRQHIRAGMFPRDQERLD